MNPARQSCCCALFIAALALMACGQQNTDSYVRAPGAETTATTRVLEAGAAVLQDREPLDAMSAYLDGFHFYNGDMDGQMEAHHYVTVLNEEVMQAVIFDGNTRNAKLMGVEYIISERLFDSLDAQEKKLWHSHSYEVSSGSLIAPGLPAAAENALMKKIVSTYGKTWHTWHTDRDKELPYGIPALMMGFTRPGQLDPALIADRDDRFGIRTSDIEARRKDIAAPPPKPGANAWEQGAIVQLTRTSGAGEHGHGKDQRPAPPAEHGSELKETGKASRQ
jgi:hypothetical protein